MQYLGFILLLISAWLGYCGVQSFNPLALLKAIASNPQGASATIAKEQAFRAGNTPDVFANDYYATPAGSSTDSAPSSGGGSAPVGINANFTPTAAESSILNSQATSPADTIVYQAYAIDELTTQEGSKAQDASGNLTAYGQAEAQAIKALWSQESGWRPNAKNASSGAFGIPQALPATKIPGGTSASAATQINWGINYILGRYGSAQAAEAHEESSHWY